MSGQPDRNQFNHQREPAKPFDDVQTGLAFGVGSKCAMFFQKIQRIFVR